MDPLTKLNQLRRSLHQHSYSDQPFIYRTGAFIGRNAISLITLPANFGLGSLFGSAGIFKICTLKVCKVALFALTGCRLPDIDASWWFNNAIHSYTAVGWNLYEYVEDLGATIEKGYHAFCFIDKHVDFKTQLVNLQKRGLSYLKRMEAIVDTIVGLFNCQQT